MHIDIDGKNLKRVKGGMVGKLMYNVLMWPGQGLPAQRAQKDLYAAAHHARRQRQLRRMQNERHKTKYVVMHTVTEVCSV